MKQNTTRKEIEDELAEFSEGEYSFFNGAIAALNLTWPMIEELKEENELLKKQLEIPRVPTIENFLRIQKERDSLLAKLNVYEEALNQINDIPPTGFDVEDAFNKAEIANDALEQAKGMK